MMGDGWGHLLLVVGLLRGGYDNNGHCVPGQHAVPAKAVELTNGHISNDGGSIFISSPVSVYKTL